MIKALVKVTTDSRSGWDSYTDEENITLTSDTEEGLTKKVKSLRRPDSIGDFGIVLRSTEVEVVRKWKVIRPEEIVLL